MDDSSICRAALSVGVGSLTGPFLVDFKVVEAEPAYQGALHAGQVLVYAHTFREREMMMITVFIASQKDSH